MNQTTKLKLDKYMLGTIALGCILCLCLFKTDSKADNPNKLPRASVTVGYREQYDPKVGDYVGIRVLYIQSSPPLPYPVTTNTTLVEVDLWLSEQGIVAQPDAHWGVRHYRR